jgi:uncharacterized protein YndB with AHSA1/START domain
MKSSNSRSRLRTVRVARRFAVPAQRVFDAWLDPAVAGKWLFATALHPIPEVEIDARRKGSFRFADRHNGDAIEYTGAYLKVVPPRHLAFTLTTKEIPNAVTRVSIDFVPLESGCKAILTHEKLPADHARHTAARWTGIFYGLAETLASIGAGPATATPRHKEKR